MAVSYLKTLPTSSAWITLDGDDSDPVNLLYSIIQSLQHVFKEIDFPQLLSYPLGRMEMKVGIPLFREWTRSLFDLIPSPLQIVLDGLDRLSSDAPAFKFLQILIEDAPPNIHLILLSREMPPLSLEFQYLKIRQGAFVLTNEELAFTLDEIREFFNKIKRISFNADQLKKIHLATEGWIGGLILLAESLSRFPELSREEYVFENLPNHFKRGVFQYFAKEIFSSQTEPIQEFLIKSSILNLIEPGFMKEFTGTENSEEILRGFTRRNLFVHSIYDEKKGWLFQYHQLFKNFLQVRFESTIKDEERKSLFLQAGELYEKRGELENALKYFLSAQAYPRAGSVIERLGMNLLQSGRKEDLSQWLLALPEEIIQENPWLLFYLTKTKQYIGGRENVVALQKAYALFKQKGDRRGKLISLAQLIHASIYKGAHVVPIGSLIEEAQAILQSLPMDEYQYEKAVLWYCLGLGHILGDGDIRKGIWACQNAYLISKQLRDLSLQAYALNFSMMGYDLVGEFSLANETCKKIEKIKEKIISPEFRVSHLMVSGVLANHLGDWARVQSLLEKLQSEIEKYGFVSIALWSYELSGNVKLSRGEFPEAEEIGKEYLRSALNLQNAFFKAMALRLLGRIYFHKGDFKKGKEAVGQSIAVLTKEVRSEHQLHKNNVLMGLICYHLQDYRAVEKKLAGALDYFNGMSSYIDAAETHFVLALLKWDQGKKDEAAAHLQTGFKIAEEKKYDYFLFLGPQYLTKVCLLALELKATGAMDYAAHLLSTRLSSGAEKEMKKLSHHSDIKVREKAWQIRRTIHRSKVPRLRIETLGGFRVWREDSLMEEKEWDRIQPKKLLMAVVSQGPQKIPKEMLMENLWPEERFDAAEKNFKTVLQRLRNSLEPVISEDFGSSYIHLHNNFVFLDPEFCEVDVDMFLSLLKKGEEEERKGDIKGALSSYVEAMEIYKGDFFPEELYAPWVDMKREEARGKYIEFLNRMATLYEKQGASTKAIAANKKAIQADPLWEEGYRNLITLYSNKGMLNEALRTYEACQKALEAGIKTKPDHTTTALYKKILEKIHST